jgi:hemerythrin
LPPEVLDAIVLTDRAPSAIGATNYSGAFPLMDIAMALDYSRGIFGRISGLHGMADVSLKQFVAWGDHLKVDQPSIDAQHEGIFNIAMEVAETWQEQGNLDRLKALTEKLAHVLDGHFRYEERQLEEVAYPKLEEHRAEHKVMLDELQGIRLRLDKMGTGTARMTPGFLVHNFILGVTVGHICNSDMDYCVFARKANEGKDQVWPPGKCPFCGSVEVKTFECDVEKWAASCASCDAIGPGSNSEREAIALWNKALGKSRGENSDG